MFWSIIGLLWLALMACFLVLGVILLPFRIGLGGIDAQKLRSSMTLFLRAEPSQPVFQQLLDRYFDGVPDAATDQRL